MRNAARTGAICGLLCLLLAGCNSMGPASVPRDRFDYITTISDSAKRQMLLNLLKVRYSDAPVFLDISSVISAYTLETSIDLFAQRSATSFGDTYRSLGASGRYADQPTISYAPLSGDKFARSVMGPIPLSAVLLLAQGGYPLDVVLRICVKTINGLGNAYGGGYAAHAGDPRFAELIGLLHEHNLAGGIDFQVKAAGEEKTDIVLSVRPPAGEAAAARQARIAELLGLSRTAGEYRIVFGPTAASDREIAIQTRSMLQILVDLASYAEVPPGDVAEERVHMPVRSAEQERMFPPLLRVRYSEAPPADAHVAVRYRERWFWIGDRDRTSKGVFGFLMLMFSLMDADTQPGPVLTIPAR